MFRGFGLGFLGEKKSVFILDKSIYFMFSASVTFLHSILLELVTINYKLVFAYAVFLPASRPVFVGFFLLFGVLFTQSSYTDVFCLKVA